MTKLEKIAINWLNKNYEDLTPMTKLEKIAINWLNKNYEDLTPFETEKYPDYIFFMKNGEIIFDYDKKNEWVQISNTKIWSFFESFFSMNYQQIQDITKVWVEEHYKLRVTTTYRTFRSRPYWWRNIIN